VAAARSSTFGRVSAIWEAERPACAMVVDACTISSAAYLEVWETPTMLMLEW
jgi:hypothetical protein